MLTRGLILLSLVWASAPGAAELAELRAHYRELTEHIADNPFGIPMSIQSREQGEVVSAEVYAVVDQPFAALADAIGNAQSWCDFVIFNVNVKACTARVSKGQRVIFYVDTKDYQEPANAYEIPYVYSAQREAERIEVHLDAATGPLGAKDNHIRVEAAAVGEKSVVFFTLTTTTSMRSRLMSAAYFATLGRNKIGFSTTPSLDDADVDGTQGKRTPIKGMQGMIERNVMRYFIALRTYLETRTLPQAGRFDAGMERWFELTEQFHAQLFEAPKADYLANKRREYANQLLLQRSIDTPATEQ